MEPRIEYSPLIQQAGKPLYKGLFCASKVQMRIYRKVNNCVAQGVDFLHGYSRSTATVTERSLEHELRAQATVMRIATKILTQKEIYHG